MNNIVISPAIGMPPEEVNLFLSTLRNFFSEEVLFLVGKDDSQLKKNLKYYECKFEEVNCHKHEIITKRYKITIDILKNKKINKILFCDSRDIYFQSNPFDYIYNFPINFFSEDVKIESCYINSDWMIRSIGQNVFEKLKNENIICCGTVVANHKKFIEYAHLMNNMNKNFPYKKRLKYFLTFRRDKKGRGCDQSYAAYIIYNKILTNFKIHSNSHGPIATVFHLKKIVFNKKNQLINENGSPYSIVHQYDKRWDKFSKIVTNLKSNLNII